MPGCRTPIPSKGKQQVGAVLWKRSIEVKPAVNLLGRSWQPDVISLRGVGRRSLTRGGITQTLPLGLRVSHSHLRLRINLYTSTFPHKQTEYVLGRVHQPPPRLLGTTFTNSTRADSRRPFYFSATPKHERRIAVERE